jgi:hypothetical protein
MIFLITILRQKIAEGGAKIVWVFRVKNHDFTPKNHIFSNCGGRRENVWGISCEKSRFYAKKIIFFPLISTCTCTLHAFGNSGKYCLENLIFVLI